MMRGFGKKARALPWTRWGLRPQTPDSLRFEKGPATKPRRGFGQAPFQTFKKPMGSGPQAQRGPGAEPLAFFFQAPS